MLSYVRIALVRTHNALVRRNNATNMNEYYSFVFIRVVCIRDCMLLFVFVYKYENEYSYEYAICSSQVVFALAEKRGSVY